MVQVQSTTFRLYPLQIHWRGAYSWINAWQGGTTHGPGEHLLLEDWKRSNHCGLAEIQCPLSRSKGKYSCTYTIYFFYHLNLPVLDHGHGLQTQLDFGKHGRMWCERTLNVDLWCENLVGDFRTAGTVLGSKVRCQAEMQLETDRAVERVYRSCSRQWISYHLDRANSLK